MGFKNLISSILTIFLAPNKASSASCMQCSSPAAAECAVCLSSLKGETTGTRALPCRHEFHAVCIDRWLAVPHFKNSCPICRFSMEDGDYHELRTTTQQECFTEEMVIWFSSFHVAGF